MRNPDITANNRVVADSNAAQHRTVGINSYIVFQNGMARHVLRFAFVVNLKVLCTKRNTLIQSDMISDYAGFSDYHARSMINREILAYLSAQMD